MKRSMNRSFKLFVMVIVAFLMIQMPAAYATNTLTDLKDKQKENQEKTSELSNSIKDKKSEIGKIENEQTRLLDQISDLSDKIDKTNANIDKVTKDINKANEEITVLQNDISELEKKIEERSVLLEERARAIQISGNVSYIDVLLGSNSFVDFIDRFSAVTTLLNADKKIMREQKEDKLKLEDQKEVLETTKKELESDQAQLQTLKASLDAQKGEKRKLVTALEAEQQKLTAEKQLLEEEYSEALNVSKEIEAQIASEQKRLAEVARKKAEEEAARKKAEAAQNNSSNNSGGVVDTGNKPAISSGVWTKPTNGRFSSAFGWRDLGFGREFHYGIDIANSVGTPIIASNGGVVSLARSLSNYGNVIMITHYVDGQIWTTVYAHLSSIQVSVGQEVSKGQQIGLMGNTGRSFGSHLHFEIHDGPWTASRPYAKNPLHYINL